jgi:hypothetical protein
MTDAELNDEYVRRYMAPGERVLLREKVVSRTAFSLSVLMALVFGLFGLAALVGAAVSLVPVGPGLAFGAPFALFGAVMGVLGVMFSVFRVMVTGSHVHVHFGWSKRKIPFAAIHTARVVTLKGFKQGKVSMGLDGVVRTWVGNSSSGRGVEITYQEEGARKHILTIGSENPERFVETVERAREKPAQLRIGEEVAPDVEAEEEAEEEEAKEERRDVS